MKENIDYQSSKDDDIDLREVFHVLWRAKMLILAVTTFFAISAVLYARSLPNIYESKVLLVPVSDSSNMKLPGQLGGLAALAGVNLRGGGSDKTGMAIEVIKSRDFIGRFIEKHELLLPLMAVQSWNRADNTLVINPKAFDVATQQWVRKKKPPYFPKPSLQEAHEKFLKQFNISQDKTTGMVSLSVMHMSPYLAQQWATWLVQEINDEMRNRELNEAQSSIAYLNKQLEQTNIADVRSMLFSLIEEQTKTVMLANVREEYVFKTIDPAVVPEKKAKPSRALICILAVMLGGMLSVMFVLIRHFVRKD